MKDSVDTNDHDELRAELAEYKARCEMYESWLGALDSFADFDLWFKDNDSRYQFVNQHFEKSMGRNRHQLLGRAPSDFFPEHRAQRVLAMDETVRKEGHIIRQVPCDESGIVQLHEEHRFVVKDRHGSVTGLGCFAHEITEKTMAEDALARAQTVGELGVWRWSVKDNILISCSEQFANILGVGLSEAYDLVRNRLVRVVHEADRPIVQRVMDRMHEPDFGPFMVEYRINRADGELRFVREVGEPRLGNSGNPLEYVGTLQDITEQKRIEEQLRRSNSELEAIVANRTRTLEQTVEQLQEFAYIASHDLQEPLRKIETFSDRLAKSCQNKLTEQESFFLDRMMNASTRMRTLIRDLLDYSRVGRHEDSSEDVDLNQILVEIQDTLEISINESQAVIHASQLPTVIGNRSQILRLFQNLVSNALKFAKPDEQPRILIRTSSAKCKSVRIEVADNGVGFDQGHAEKIFGVFQRLHAKSDYEGTGIGLATCRKIVQNHGGRIWAESAPGEGSRFFLELPCTA